MTLRPLFALIAACLALAPLAADAADRGTLRIVTDHPQCNDQSRILAGRAGFAARTLSRSPAFHACIHDRFAAGHRLSAREPFSGSSGDDQARAYLRALGLLNGLDVECMSTSSATPSARVGPYGRTDTIRARVLNGIVLGAVSGNRPVCPAAGDCVSLESRVGHLARVTGLLMRSLAHGHGFVDSAEVARTCAVEVLDASRVRCGDPESIGGALYLAEPGGGCAEVPVPRVEHYGQALLIAGPHDQWLTAADALHPSGSFWWPWTSGDFDGDGAGDLVVRDFHPDLRNYAMGILRTGRDTNGPVAPRTAMGERTGGWLHGSSDVPIDAADLDGDGADELIMGSGWGIGALAIDGASLTSRALHPFGTRLDGGWTLDRADDIEGSVRGPQGGRLLIESATGDLGVLDVHAGRLRARRVLTDWTMVPRVDGGTLPYESRDRVATTGDFDGDGYEEVLLYSPGWGMYTYDPFAHAVGPIWREADVQRVLPGFALWPDFFGATDLDHDGQDELVVQHDGDLLVVDVDAAGFSVAHRWSPGRRLGHWLLGAGDMVVDAGRLGPGGTPRIALRSGWGIGLVGLEDGRPTSSHMRRYGDIVGYGFVDRDDVWHGGARGRSVDRLIVQTAP